MSGLNAARLYVPDCIGASRSIFARDGPALLKAVTTGQRQKHCGNLASSGCMLSVCFMFVCTAVIWLFENLPNSGVLSQRVRGHSLNHSCYNSFRRSIETKLRPVAENLENLEKEFPELSEAQRSTILTVMSDSSSLNGLYFEHVWYVHEHNVLYNGHIIFVKPLTKSKIISHNVTMTTYGLLADYIAGDLNLSGGLNRELLASIYCHC